MCNFPIDKKEIKIGILGYTEGNGHPYSWSAMFNGYNKEVMENENSLTGDYLSGRKTIEVPKKRRKGNGEL